MDDNFNMICEGSAEEAENNNKLYNYKKEEANCDKNTKEVTISDIYETSKLEKKNNLPSDELKDNLDDNYILSLDDYQNAISKKGYTCQEK